MKPLAANASPLPERSYPARFHASVLVDAISPACAATSSVSLTLFDGRASGNRGHLTHGKARGGWSARSTLETNPRDPGRELLRGLCRYGVNLNERSAAD
jgi:hypothetical protein